MSRKLVRVSRPSCTVSAQGDEHHALWSANPLATGEISVTKHFCSISRCQDLTFARFIVDYSVNKVIYHFYSSLCLQGVIFLRLMASALIFGPSVATCLKMQSNPQINSKWWVCTAWPGKERLTLSKIFPLKLPFLSQRNKACVNEAEFPFPRCLLWRGSTLSASRDERLKTSFMSNCSSDSCLWLSTSISFPFWSKSKLKFTLEPKTSL